MHWNDWIQGQETALRIGLFLGVLLLMAGWERLAPRRELTASRPTRWLNNFAVVLIDSLLIVMLVWVTGSDPSD